MIDVEKISVNAEPRQLKTIWNLSKFMYSYDSGEWFIVNRDTRRRRKLKFNPLQVRKKGPT